MTAVPIQDEIDEIGEAIEQTNQDSESAQNEADSLAGELARVLAEYQASYARLQEIDEAVIAQAVELKKAVEQQERYQIILDRLNVLAYRDGNVYFVEVVLGTRTFKDLLVRLDFLAKLNNRQARTLGDAKALKKKTEKRRDKLAEQKKEQKRVVALVEVKQANIDRLLFEQQALIDSLNKEADRLTGEQKEKMAEKERREAEEARALAFAAQAGQSVDADINLVFPVPQSYASSYINDWGFSRAGNSAGHQGTDIFARKGTPLIAVADGVISDDFGNSRVGGYRLHIIDNQGVDYYYAHLNNDSPGTDDGMGGAVAAFAPGIAPGVGVTKGQIIGYIGDSGDAEPTPAHLHFSISVGGTYVNPFPYLKGAGRI